MLYRHPRAVNSALTEKMECAHTIHGTFILKGYMFRPNENRILLWGAILFFATLIVGVALIPMGGTTVTREAIPDERVQHVERVLIHDLGDTNGNFTLFIQEPGSQELKPIRIYAKTYRVVKDVPRNSPMWAIKGQLVKIKHNDPSYDYVTVGSLELHIRNEKDLEGAAWERTYHRNKSTVTERGATIVLCCQ